MDDAKAKAADRDRVLANTIPVRKPVAADLADLDSVRAYPVRGVEAGA